VPGAATLALDCRRVAPEFPAGDWHNRTIAWWSTVWASPMAGMWLESDTPVLERLAELLDALYRGDRRARILNEIRQLEDRFGLSPLARRRLQWEIEHRRPAQPEVPTAGGDERWLRVVDPM
jgi:hypothetical protein